MQPKNPAKPTNSIADPWGNWGKVDIASTLCDDPFNEAAQGECTSDDTDKTTKQLLNELYHDRARLERVVKNACDLVVFLAAAVSGNEDVDEEYAVGLAEQFVDDNGSEDQIDRFSIEVHDQDV